MVYIDESIDEDIYLLGGVFLPSSKYRKFNKDIEQFIIKELDFNPDVEIHADYIWNGRDDFEGLSMDYRAEITETISKFLGDSTLTKTNGVKP